MLLRTLLAGFAAAALVAAGCHHCCHRKDCGPPAGAPLPRGERIPPPDVPTTPGVFPAPSVVPEPRSSFRVDPGVDPSPGSWVGPAPGKPDPLLQAPTAPRKTESLFGDPIPNGAPPVIDVPGEKKRYLDDPVPPAKENGTKPADPPKAMDPAPAADRPAPPPRATVPASVPGLPGYAAVAGHDGVAAGRKPTLEGFDALKANAFRTVVFLYAPNADVAPARELAQQRGLKFVPIAVSPGTLKAAFDDFTAALADKPVYVADEDGQRAGALWYLLFRTQDLLGDDAARVRARPLGLTDAVSEEQKQFWVAVQDYLAKR